MASGAADVILAPAAITAGGASAILGSALENDAMMIGGLIGAGIGLNMMHDGAAAIETAIDGKTRPSGYEKVGEFFMGQFGADIGRSISKAGSISSIARGFRNVIRRRKRR